MSDMTPQEARELLHDWQEGGMVDWDDSRRALETIAADQAQYRHEVKISPIHEWEPASRWEYEKMMLSRYADLSWNRIVARRVSTPWEVTE